MNKRGDYSGIFLFIVFAFMITVFAVVFTFIGNTVETSLHTAMDDMVIGDGSNNMTELIDDTVGVVNDSYKGLTWITILIIGAMILSILMGSFLVTTHPVFFIPYFIIVIIAILVGAGVSNAYETLASDPTLASTFLDFKGAGWILLRLPIVNTIIGFAGAIIMFIAWRLGQQQGGYYG